MLAPTDTLAFWLHSSPCFVQWECIGGDHIGWDTGEVMEPPGILQSCRPPGYRQRWSSYRNSSIFCTGSVAQKGEGQSLLVSSCLFPWVMTSREVSQHQMILGQGQALGHCLLGSLGHVRTLTVTGTAGLSDAERMERALL